MKQRLLPLLLAFVLFLTACGDATTETDSASDSGGDRVENASDDVSSDGDSDNSGGWLGGEPGDTTADDGGSADGLGLRVDTTDAGDFDMADEAAPSLLEPPIDPHEPGGGNPLQVGSIDDAADVARYLEYRSSITQAGVQVRPLDVSDSTVFTVIGSNGLPVLDASIQIWAAQGDTDQSSEPLRTLHTRADGTARFLPSTLDPVPDALAVTVLVDGEVTTLDGFTIGTADVTVNVDSAGGYDGSVPLDIVFVLDATGSMGDEIERLRSNMTSVAQQIDALPSQPDVRFGMTIYRDEGGAYVKNTFDLTENLDEFLDALNQVVAEGGGDYPEAMDEALADAMELPDWRRQDAVQLMFLLADAPPQVGRAVQLPYTDTAVLATENGVKIFPVAASGTDDQAEYVMRELAFVTGGRFVFLSYGGGDSATGSGSDITNQDYDELPLDQLVVRLVQDELAALTGIEPGQGQSGVTATTVPPPTTTLQ